MTLRLLLVPLLIAAFIAPLGAAPPTDPAQVLWSKDYPKAVPSATRKGQSEAELFGTYTLKPGWSIEKAEFTTTPKAGGVRSKATKLEYYEGKWGARDPKDETKIIPMKVPVPNGGLSFWILFTLKGTDPATGKPTTVPWLATVKSVDAK